MPITLLLTSAVLDVHHDSDQAWLYLDWKGPQEVALVQAACARVTALLRETGVHKILNDNTHITQTSWELVRWVAYDYLPVIGEAGLRYVAWVQSPLPTCRGHVERMTESPGKSPRVAVFSDMAAAYDWLSNATMPAKT